jgi:hypothetical protein
MDNYQKYKDEQKLKVIERERIEREAASRTRTESTKAALGSLQLRLSSIDKIADQ